MVLNICSSCIFGPNFKYWYKLSQTFAFCVQSVFLDGYLQKGSLAASGMQLLFLRDKLMCQT